MIDFITQWKHNNIRIVIESTKIVEYAISYYIKPWILKTNKIDYSDFTINVNMDRFGSIDDGLLRYNRSVSNNNITTSISINQYYYTLLKNIYKKYK